MWNPINSAPAIGTKPYDWQSGLVGQCTWGAYWRVQQNGYPAPVYNDREKKVPGFNNGKTWLDNYREPWIPIKLEETPDYNPVPGDIIVWDGNYGHVAVVEVDNYNGTYGISSWNSEAPEEYGYISNWQKNSIIPIKYKKGFTTGKCLGYLHYDPKRVVPVIENPNVNQIYCNDTVLRVRLAPNLSGEYYCNMGIGFFNVFNISEADGYRWFEIEPGKYCADIGWEKETETGVKYIPSSNKEYMRLLEENRKLKEALKQIVDIANQYSI